MSDTIEIRVPDIGDFKDVPVIEVLVKPGDTIKKNDSLLTLESEKASMDVPSSANGVVDAVTVKVGDKVSQGTPIITLRQAQGDTAKAQGDTAKAQDNNRVMVSSSNHPPEDATPVELRVPDIGDFNDIPIIDVLVKPGDTVKANDSIVTLESEKASMDVPAGAAGTIASVSVKVGDKVSKGSVIATLRQAQGDTAKAQGDTAKAQGDAAKAQGDTAKAQDNNRVMVSSSNHAPPVLQASTPTALRQAQGDTGGASNGVVHASPAIRRFARELGVNIAGVSGSGPNGRVTREDVQSWVKRALREGGGGVASSGTTFAGLPAWPKVDFAQFGPIERVALPRVKKFSGPNLHRNWLQIPHITNYDEADITDLEAFRNEINAEQGKSGGAKLTMLAFLVKACVAALQRFPDFNSSLDGDELVRKNYFNIGFAADTPNGLVVPVLKNADAKGLVDIARESAELAGKAREGKLGMADMQGGTFTISSIGGIGGTQFTQIVNAPEVAILGSTRSAIKPVWDGTAFAPRLMLPISVSYDHRVIDGAGAARFLVYVASLLRDFRRVLL